MRIFFLINCLSYGGAEKNLKLIADYLADNGDKISICSLNYHPTTISFQSAIKLVELPNRKGHFLKLLGIKFLELRRILSNEKPDIIVSFLGYANILNVLLGKTLNIPSIISERADPYLKSDHIMANWINSLFQFIYTFSDGAVFQTIKARDFFAPRLRKRSIVIPNPVIMPPNSPIHLHENAEKRIAFVGRFELKQKRQDIALKAFNIVLQQYPNYILSFYGDGQDEPKVKALVQQMNIENNVTFNSVSKNIFQDISTAEMFILSSDYEGIPNCLIEALSIGLPCISTDCSPGGARILIEHNKNGIIVPCGNYSALADAICFYIANPHIAKQYGENALDIKNKYSFEKIMKYWKEYIHSFNN